MLESFLITSRETLEASLVVGIVLSYLNKTNNQNYRKTVYYGIFFGILTSILAAFAFTFYAGGFQGEAEEIFEGLTILIGAFFLTTMILWMMKQRHITHEIEGKVERHLMNSQPLFSHAGIFLLIFVAIIREGIETVIFLNAINYASKVNFISGTLGIIVAVIIGYLFFVSTRKINLKKLFGISSILLILFAAGLVAHGVYSLQESGIISGIINPLYDINPRVNADGSYPALHDHGIVGSFFRSMFGYSGSPSLLEVLAYFSYLIGILFLYKKIGSSNTVKANS